AQHDEHRRHEPRVPQRREQELLFEVDVAAQRLHGARQRRGVLFALRQGGGKGLDALVDLAVLALQRRGQCSALHLTPPPRRPPAYGFLPDQSCFYKENSENVTAPTPGGGSWQPGARDRGSRGPEGDGQAARDLAGRAGAARLRAVRPPGLRRDDGGRHRRRGGHRPPDVLPLLRVQERPRVGRLRGAAAAAAHAARRDRPAHADDGRGAPGRGGVQPLRPAGGAVAPPAHGAHPAGADPPGGRHPAVRVLAADHHRVHGRADRSAPDGAGPPARRPPRPRRRGLRLRALAGVRRADVARRPAGRGDPAPGRRSGGGAGRRRARALTARIPARSQPRSSRMARATTSPIRTAVAAGPRSGATGRIEVSATRSPSRPRTLPRASTADPIGTVPQVCWQVPSRARTHASSARSSPSVRASGSVRPRETSAKAAVDATAAAARTASRIRRRSSSVSRYPYSTRGGTPGSAETVRSPPVRRGACAETRKGSGAPGAVTVPPAGPGGGSSAVGTRDWRISRSPASWPPVEGRCSAPPSHEAAGAGIGRRGAHSTITWGWSLRAAPTEGRSCTTRMPPRSRSAAGPTPDRWSRCGEASAPAHSTISSASRVTGRPSSSATAPAARPRSMISDRTAQPPRTV